MVRLRQRLSPNGTASYVHHAHISPLSQAQSTIISNAANVSLTLPTLSAPVPRPVLMRHLLQLRKYLDLPQKGKVMAEYVWIDGSNGIRSKSKVSLGNATPSSERDTPLPFPSLPPPWLWRRYRYRCPHRYRYRYRAPPTISRAEDPTGGRDLHASDAYLPLLASPLLSPTPHSHVTTLHSS